MKFDTKPILARSFAPVHPNMQKEFSEMEKFDSSDIDISDYNDLLTQFFVDRKQLLQNISAYRKKHILQFTLGDLLSEYPITKGMAEIAVYYDLLNSEKDLTIDESSREMIQYENNENIIKVTVPKLIFKGDHNV